ncbi:MAG: magnesium and cobalt transport protein CorA [Candidatus Riflebacteria bacterium GWC2_50_8]|nr:MAG: magnesium and cobalt transport protein CorA [Candidatus Riflebacteria bacterium GWC2_50_8]
MLPFVKKGIAESKAGHPQGTIVNFSPDRVKQTVVELFNYDQGHCSESKVVAAADLAAIRRSSGISWLCFFGLGDVEMLRQTAEIYEINPLSVEDILNPDHRPKLEVFDNYLLIIVKMIDISDEGRLLSEQVSFVVGDNYVLTFQERPGDVFDPIRDRLRKNVGRIRSMASDYLALSLIDVIIDNYFVVLEGLASGLEEIELTLLKVPDGFEGREVHEVKMQLFYMRKICWPLREIASALLRSESPIIRPESRIYFRDIYDHTVHVLETSETLREVSIGVYDLYISNISLRMNEIMRTLTIIATIFIPLTFIAGVYGMNFENMPELKWTWGYYGILALMLAVALGMLKYFRRRNWL